MPEIQTYTDVGSVLPTDKLLGVRNGQTVLVEGLQDPTTGATIEGIVAVSISGTYTLDPALGNDFDLTLTGDTVITASATLTVTQKREIIYRIVNSGTFKLTWAGVVWNDGLAPVMANVIGAGITGRIVFSVAEISGFAQLDANASLEVSKLTVNGRIKGRKPVIPLNNPSTAPYIVPIGDSGTTYTNTGSAVKAYANLPDNVTELEYTFYVQNTNGLRFVAPGVNTIRSNTTVSGSGGFAESTTVGSVMTICKINATEWVSKSTLGTWTIT